MLSALRCPTCSAPLDASARHGNALKCPYCNSTAVLTDRSGNIEAVASGDSNARAIAEVLRDLYGGNKLAAIKTYREHFGVGLKEAKDAVERLAAGQPQGAIPAAALATGVAVGGAGCIGIAIFLIMGIGGALFYVFSRAPTSDIPNVPGIPAMPNIPGISTNPSAPADDGFMREAARFGSEGTGAGRFEDARSVAVDGQGRVYVAEYSGGRVQVFDANGTFVTQWVANADMPMLDLDAGRDGTVYAVQYGRLSRYDGATGEARGTLNDRNNYNGLALALDGTFWAITSEGVEHLDRNGRVLASHDLTDLSSDRITPDDIAVSGAGHVYVSDLWSGVIFHLDPDGRFIDRFGGDGEGPEAIGRPGGMAFDGQGRLFVSSLGNGIVVFDGDGHYIDRFGDGVIFGITFTDADELYATYRNDHAIVRFVPAPAE